MFKMHFMPLASSFMLLKGLVNRVNGNSSGPSSGGNGHNPSKPDDEGEVLEGEFREM